MICPTFAGVNSKLILQFVTLKYKVREKLQEFGTKIKLHEKGEISLYGGL